VLRRDLAFLLLPFPATAADSLDAFGQRWNVPNAADWEKGQEEGREVLHLRVARPPQADAVRRPAQHALLEQPACGKFQLEVDVRRDAAKDNSAVIIVYAWQSPLRFNYVHLCQESALQQPRHNGVFHVLDGERVRISPIEGAGALPDGAWRHVQISWNGATGRVETRVDGRVHPSLRAADLSLTSGRVGLGSFFNTGSFRNFRLRSS
jgi:hypothetical protein